MGKKKKPKDKRLTLNQCKREINRALDVLESAVLITLHEEFGFGPKRRERFMQKLRINVTDALLELDKERKRLVK